MRRAAAAAAAALRGASSAIRHAGSSAAAEFPRHPSQLSAAWLTAALTEAGRIPSGATVRCVAGACAPRTRISSRGHIGTKRSSPFVRCRAFSGEQIGAGVGLASLLHRLTLDVEPPAGSGAPHERISAVAKFAPTEKEVRRRAKPRARAAEEPRAAARFSALTRRDAGAGDGFPAGLLQA